MSYLGREAAKAPIVTADLPNDGVTLAKMTGGTDGQIITYDASGNPVAVGPGSDGQVLTSTGAGSPPAFEAGGVDAADIGAGVLPSDVTGGSGLTALGTVTAGNLSNTAIVYPAGHIVKWEHNATTAAGIQGADTTYTDLTGSSVSYTPATGATYVVYEYSTTVSGSGEASGANELMIQLLKFYYDGSMVANTNWHLRMSDSIGGRGYQFLKFVLPAWSGAKTMSVKYRAWHASDYNCQYHTSLYSGDASTADVFTKQYQTTYSVM